MGSVLDTNVLLRFLVGDVPSQQAQAARWFKEAELGKRSIAITPIVIAEACFVLETFYRQTRGEIVSVLEVFVAQEWLSVQERGALLGTWKWYASGLHFVDSFLLAWSEITGADILSFDQKLMKRAKNKK